MNKHNEQFPEELFDLFSRKMFNELTAEERDFALAHTTADEYDQMAESVLSFTKLDESIEINTPGIKSLHHKTGNKKRWWNYRIPLYQAVAASIVLAVAYVALLQFSGNKTIDSTSNIANPVALKSISLDDEAIDRHFAEIESIVKKKNQEVGISLADDNYPKGLVFDF